MGKALVNVIILLSVLAFGVFYGVDIAKNGIEQVNGPIGTASDLTVEKMALEQQQLVLDHKERMRLEAEQELRELQEQKLKEEQQSQPVVVKQSLLSRLISKLGDVISCIANFIIHGVVNMGRAIFT